MDGFLDAQIQAALTQANGPSGLQAGRGSNAEQAREIAEEFEAVFLAQLMEHMMGETTEQTFGGGAGEKAWKGMLNEEYAKVMAQAGGIGLADDLAREIMRLQTVGEDQ